MNRFLPFIVQIAIVSFVSSLSIAAQVVEITTQCSAPEFIAGRSNSSPYTPAEVVSADFNNDGKKDLAEGISGSSFGNSSVAVKLGDGAGNFALVDSIAVPSFVTNITVGDFNADGFLDLIVTHRWTTETNGFSLLIGTGDGQFSNFHTTLTPGQTYSPVSGDFNGDDRRDLAVADSSSNLVKIFYGDNNGTFSDPLDILVGSNPLSLAAGDFNGDRRDDLIVANNASAFASAIISAPNGGFEAAVSIPIQTDYHASFVSVADINQDGKLDAVVNSVRNQFATGYLSSANILLGNGVGGFVSLSPLQYEIESDKTWLVDVNNDSKPDLIGSKGGTSTGVITVRLGAGDGAFSNEIFSTTAATVYAIVAEDFNSDGHIDLVESGGGNSEVYIFHGSGDGRFGSKTFGAGQRPNSTATADFNLDGKPDLVFGDYDAYAVVVMTNNGNNSFSNTSTFTLPEHPWSVFTGDFNNDSKPDIGTIDWETQSGRGGMGIMINNGAGGFAPPVMYYLSSRRFMRAVAVADMTGDGNLDIVIAYVDDNGWIYINKGNGDGTFSFYANLMVPTTTFNSWAPFGVAVGDFNGDTKKDVAATAAGNLVIFLDIEHGPFAARSYFPVTTSPVAELAVADFNRDGHLDAAVVNNSSNASSPSYVTTVSILFGNGSGSFSAPTSYPIGRGMASISIADMNGDLEPDLVMSGGYLSAYKDNRVGIMYGSPTGSFAPMRSLVSGAWSWDTTIADFNLDGKLDFVTPNYYYGDASIVLNGCPGTPPTDFPALSIGPDVNVTETDSGATDITLNVTLSAPSTRQVSAKFFTSAGTAVGGADYVARSEKLVFEPNETSKTITVSVKGDLVDEFNESLHVILVNPLNASISDREATISIIEDVDPAPSINIGDFSFDEGSTGSNAVSIPVSLSSISGKPISVHVQTSPGTATSGDDFTPVSATLSFVPGSVLNTANIPINGDTLVEPDETFSVTISSPVNAILGRAVAAAIIVNDDIGGNVQFNNSTFNIAENAGSVNITVSRANGNASNIVVQYSTGNGSATAGQDYTIVSGSVVFGANETTKTFAVPILNDLLDEEDGETVNLSITGVTGGATTGNPINAVLNIQDDDPLPLINVTGVSTAEGNAGTSTVLVPVQLLTASGREVRVNYSTIDGSATASSDYLPVSGLLVFSPGETNKTIAVSIIGDEVREPNESFQVSLSGPVNTTLNVNPATIVITNDDDSVAQFDFDGDGKTDPSVYRPSIGDWYLLNTTTGFRALHFGLPSDIMVPADYTGDGKTDMAVWRPSDSIWYVLRSEDNTFYGAGFGATGDIPAPGDYDGDGKADLGVIRPDATQSYWYLQQSTAGFAVVPFGLEGDVPTLGDYDGDGKNDVAVYRPSAGAWFRFNSSNGAFLGVGFGAAGDKIVPADYTGDGKTDLAVFRPSNNIWYILKSEDNSLTGGAFGSAGDHPSPGDYDGDGKADLAVYRPGATPGSQSVFYVLQTTAGFNTIPWGLAEDRPVPGAYVY